MSLAAQYLVLQLLIVLAVLVGVIAVSLAQSEDTFERVEGRRALSAAESVAAMPAVRSLLPGAQPGHGAALPAVAESARTVSGSSFVLLVRPDRVILTTADPSLLGSALDLGESHVLEGRAWTGAATVSGHRALVAHVPVLSDDGSLVGFVAVGRDYPSVLDRLGEALPDLVTYLGVSLALGAAGSVLLSRRVKKQTLGLEPEEIVGLVEHREAILHGVKEGVLALDQKQRITVLNESARAMLDLPRSAEGHSLEELGVDPRLREVLVGEDAVEDRIVLAGERLVSLNRRPVVNRGREIGSVTTLRDRTELAALEQELGATRSATDTLRAQTHEFANQLHTISGLIQLQEYDDVLRFVDGVRLSRTRLYDEVTERLQDPAVAALVIAKASLAAERAVPLDIDPASRLGRVGEGLSRDLCTVVGNLVDNALDAVSGHPDARVTLLISDDGGRVGVRVRDTGPGVAGDKIHEVFRQGYTTKDAQGEGGHGFGLAITQLVCRRRGGDVEVLNDHGAVFTAVLGRGTGAGGRPLEKEKAEA